jgi:UDP-N-acetylglucosamine 2-epimerase (non-hydrolysing)
MANTSKLRDEQKLAIAPAYLPISVSKNLLDNIVSDSKVKNIPILAIVTGTKPDFYKQAPLVAEAQKEGIPTLIINTGQHFDDLLGFGVKEFHLEEIAVCNLHIRGDLMEKASELLLKFGRFGRFCQENYQNLSMLPVVHGDTLVAGIATLGWVFGMGQKVGQNEAGLRSMSPIAMRDARPSQLPLRKDIEQLVDQQLNGKWFVAREEPFPEQIDTWICSAGTQYFFAPVKLNKENLIREGYPDEDIYVVGNSVVDAIAIKRKEKPVTSIFNTYPELESGEWLRVDIHRRENLTERRFHAIIESISQIVNKGYKVVFIRMNATDKALQTYGLENKLQKLSEERSNFLMTPLWKEYANVVEFLDSGHCWGELTDSGSMQEELLYFPKVLSMTVRLSTDRPETVFDARGNILIPPVNAGWISEFVDYMYKHKSVELLKKKQIYGEPGQVSQKVISVIKKEFESGRGFFPWLHHRLNLWTDDKNIEYL